MKFIENKQVPLEGRARHFAALAKAVVVDTEGVYTTVAHWLCGENPWGFHNDLRFTMPPSNIRQGNRIVAAAEYAIDNEGQYLALSDEDYEVLMLAISRPERHVGEMRIPTALARELLPILEALESATSNLRDTEPVKRAPSEHCTDHPMKEVLSSSDGLCSHCFRYCSFAEMDPYICCKCRATRRLT